MEKNETDNQSVDKERANMDKFMKDYETIRLRMIERQEKDRSLHMELRNAEKGYDFSINFILACGFSLWLLGLIKIELSGFSGSSVGALVSGFVGIIVSAYARSRGRLKNVLLVFLSLLFMTIGGIGSDKILPIKSGVEVIE